MGFEYEILYSCTTHLIEIENVPDVSNSLPPSLLSPNMESTGDQVVLSVLDRHHLLLN